MRMILAQPETPMSASKPLRRRATNLSVDAALLGTARDLGVNLSRAAEDGIRRAVALEATARWRRENAEALRQSDAYVETHGLPLAAYRQF